MSSGRSKDLKSYNVNVCFECGEPATEHHHIIPRVLGGKKTIPLCTCCHMKVHGLHGTKRADNHVENVKRGLDKFRAWDLFALYQIIYFHDVTGLDAIREKFDTEFNLSLTTDQVQRLYNRLMEIDEHYMKILFDKHIDSDLSYIWNENDEEYRNNLLINELNFLIGHLSSLEEINVDDYNAKHLAKEIMAKVSQEFKKYKNS